MENKERLKYFKDQKIIAIDPGANGGITVFSVDKNKVIEVRKMLDSPLDILNFLKMYKNNSRCYLEKVQGMPGQSGPGSFNFGRGFGWLQMSLLALKIPTIEVTPQVWQKALQLGVKGKMTDTQWKNKLKSKAQQIFPHLTITLALSDSLLISEYARIKEKI